MPQDQIQQVWAVELEILDVINKVCIENGLRYSLGYGTLIGAMRHKGFIPWDDDIDLMMPRDDYEKLLSIWNQVAPKEYILQNARTDSDFTQSFTKIRKNHTTFLQFEFERVKKYHKGIFVDIFPGDRVAPSKLGQKIQYVACVVNLLYTRGHSSGSTGLIGQIERFLLQTSKEKYISHRQLSENFIRRWNTKNATQYVFPSTLAWCKKYYPSTLFEDLKTIEFCGKSYQCFSNPDAILKLDYGDYMQLPPEKERIWKHHPIIIDFKHNYEELT